MNSNIKDKWVAALRSGEYAQDRSVLRSDNGYCCLGVLCDLYRKEGSTPIVWKESTDETFPAYWFDGDNEIMPYVVRTWAGMHSPSGAWGGGENQCLAYLNDTGEYDFNDLADIIEENWEQL